MGVSIYYTARRARPLIVAEGAAIAGVVERHPIETLLAACRIADGQYDGEGFCVYPADEDTEPGVIFEGATKLPLCSEEVFWEAVQYWLRLLSQIRRVLPDADWHVHIDDHDIAWDEESNAFDPSAS